MTAFLKWDQIKLAMDLCICSATPKMRCSKPSNSTGSAVNLNELNRKNILKIKLPQGQLYN